MPQRPRLEHVEDVGGVMLYLITALIAVEHARETSDRELAGAYLRMAREELLFAGRNRHGE